MATALWVPAVNAEPHKIYSNGTPHVTCEKSTGEANPCPQAPACAARGTLRRVWKVSLSFKLNTPRPQVPPRKDKAALSVQQADRAAPADL